MARKKKTQDPFRQNIEEFDGFPPAIVFDEVGTLVIGHVVRYSEGNSEYGLYPICVVADEDSGDEVSLHLFHYVLARKFAELAPAPGERVAVKYLGKKDGKDSAHDAYKNFEVRVDRGEDTSPKGADGVEWGSYFDGALMDGGDEGDDS